MRIESKTDRFVVNADHNLLRNRNKGDPHAIYLRKGAPVSGGLTLLGCPLIINDDGNVCDPLIRAESSTDENFLWVSTAPLRFGILAGNSFARNFELGSASAGMSVAFNLNDSQSAAFNIERNANKIFEVDTTSTDRILLGEPSPTIDVQFGDDTTPTTIHAYIIGSLYPRTNVAYDLGGTGNTWREIHGQTVFASSYLQSKADNVKALDIQNAAGIEVLTVDTTTKQTNVNNPTDKAGALNVKGSSTQAGTFIELGTTSNERALQFGSGTSYGWRFNADESATGDMYIRSLIGGTEYDVMHFKRNSSVRTVGFGKIATGGSAISIDTAGAVYADRGGSFNNDRGTSADDDFKVLDSSSGNLMLVDISENAVALGGSTFTNRGYLALKGDNTKAGVFVQLSGVADNIIMQSGSTDTFGWKWMQNESTTGDMFLKRRTSSTDNYVMYFKRSNGRVGFNMSSAPSYQVEVNGSFNCDDAEIDGALNHDGSTVGFYGVAPVARPAAYTQTYSTSTRTHSLFTNNTVSWISTNSSPWGYQSQAQADSIPTELNNLRADVANVKNVLNQVIDDLQSVGLMQ